MRPLLLVLAITGIATLSFWAGEGGRGWVALPVGVLVGIVVVAVELAIEAARQERAE